ncbi:MAG: glycosyltransferase family 2 protein [Mycetocola sp.]
MADQRPPEASSASADGYAVIAVNYASHQLLQQNLEPSTSSNSRATIIVVDNFSSDAELDAVTGLCQSNDWVLLPRPNDGFGAGMNTGVAHAISLGLSVFVLINPDLHADAQSLDALADQAVSHPDTLTAPRILRPDGSLWFAGGVVCLEDGTTKTKEGTDSTQPNGWLTGACLSVHLDLWSRLGGFDDDYFLYWEDVDLSWRCRALGGHLAVRRDITVVHSVGGTQQATGKSPLYYYYNCRNRLLFARKHLDLPTRRRWIRRSPSVARLIVLRGGKRQFLSTPWKPIQAAIAGTVAGLRSPQSAFPRVRRTRP